MKEFKYPRRKLSKVEKSTEIYRWVHEMALFAQLCNTWWRRYFMPAQSVVIFGCILVPLYFSITTYDSHLPFYIYGVYPTIGIVTLGCAVVVYAQLAHVYVCSIDVLKNLRTLSQGSGREPKMIRRKLTPEPKRVNKDFMLIVRSVVPAGQERVPRRAATICTAKWRKLFASRPLRVEVGDFGHYVKVGAGSKVISEVFTYLIILLKLRELRRS